MRLPSIHSRITHKLYFRSVEDNANNYNATKMPFSTFNPTNNNLNTLDYRTNGNRKSQGNGILKKPPRAPPSSATSTPKRVAQQKSSEARNEAVSF